MLRFTIRELALVTIIVAMGLAWWLDRASLAVARAEAVEDATSLTQFFDPALATNPHLAPLRLMLSRKYPQKAPEPAGPGTSSFPSPPPN